MPMPSKVPLRAAPSTPRTEEAPATTPPAKPTRRAYTAAEKLRIVREADACTERGQVEALLRREGIYSSLLAAWRKALRLHGEKGLTERGPGRKATRDARDERIAQLERDNGRLERELVLTKKLVDLQKKVSEILDVDLARSVER
jgi:transposase